MNNFFHGRTQTAFTRHSGLDNGTYVTFKDASRDQENPVSLFVVVAGMAGVGYLVMCVLSAWGF